MAKKKSNELEKGIRLNKYIADSGLCSRREADSLIEQGHVKIDGRPGQLGSRVLPDQVVLVRGQPVLPRDNHVYIILYKPKGITCTTDLRRRDNIISFMNYPERIFPIGRLDRDSEGLIFLTNDGSVVNKILRAEYKHEKEYRVTVDKPLTAEFLQNMARGVPILDTMTQPCRVIKEKEKVFRIILTQGLNRQIRRMCAALGYEVTHLVRIRIMHIGLGRLRPGQWRYFNTKELVQLRRLIKTP